MTTTQQQTLHLIIDALQGMRSPGMIYIAREGLTPTAGQSLPWPGSGDAGAAEAKLRLVGILNAVSCAVVVHLVAEGYPLRRAARFPFPAPPGIPFGDPAPGPEPAKRMKPRAEAAVNEGRQKVREATTEGQHGEPTRRVVAWPGVGEFELTEEQATVVRVLAEAYSQNRAEMPESTLLRRARSAAGSLAEMFEGSEAWGVLVVSGGKEGWYRLPMPE